MTIVRGWIVVVLAVTACGDRDRDRPTAEPTRVDSMSTLLPVPPDPTNRYADDPRAAALGQMLFFERDLAGPLLVDSALGPAGSRGALSCRTCHAGPALDDQHSRPNHVSTGTRIGGRNAPPVLNAVYYAWTNWGGRFDSQWSLAIGALENPEVMNGSRLALAHVLYAQYRAEYEALFPEPLPAALDPAASDAGRFPAEGKPGMPAWDAMTADDRAAIDRVAANAGKAIAAYMRTLVATSGPFDRFAAGDTTAISPAAQRGLALFRAHCESCHSGPHFQDGRFHALGVAQFGPNVPATDLGRFTDIVPLLASPFSSAGPHSDGPSRITGLAQTPAQRGQFRTPSLRNVAVTAPYMHAGQFPTLAAVVAFYNAGGGRVDEGVTKAPEMKRLGLTPEQQADLVAFMETLTDTDVAAARLVDTSR